MNGIKVAFLCTDGFEQVEMVKPRRALEEQGIKTALISDKSTVQGWNHVDKGDSFEVDVLLDDANPYDYHALVLPGGVINPDALRIMPAAIEFTKKMHEQNKLIAAICHGPWTLINCGLVKNKQLTSWSSIKTDLVNAGAQWIDKAVVRDGNLITSRKPDDIPEFSKAIIEVLSDVKS